MGDERKTKAQLIGELRELRKQVAELKRSDSDFSLPKKGGQEIEKYFGAFLDNIKDGVYVINDQGYFAYMNKAAMGRSGIPSKKLKKVHYLSIPKPQDREQVKNNFEKVMRGEAIPPHEVEYFTSRGKSVVVEITTNPLYHEGNVMGLLGISRDVTARTRAEEELQRAHDDLEQRVNERTEELLKANEALAAEIQERKRGEDARRKSEDQYRVLVETMNEGIVVLDKNDSFSYINKKFSEMIGYSEDEIIGCKAGAFLDKENFKFLKKQLAARRKGGQNSYQLARTRKDGQKVHTMVSPRPLSGEDGRYAGSFAAVIDITELNRVENALRESEEHFRSLMESASNFAVYRLVRDREKPYGFSVVFVSPSIADIMGVSAPMEFETWLENIDPDDLARLTEASAQGGKTGKFNETVRIYHPHKEEWRWIQDIGTRVLVENERHEYVNGIILDITEQRKASEAAREQTLRNELILQTAMDGFFIIDMKGKIVKANHAARKILGYPLKKLVNMTIGDLEVEDSASVSANHFQRVVKRGSNRLETRFVGKDGKIVDVEVTTNFISLGEEKFFFSFFHDITERNRTFHALSEREEELSVKTDALEEVNTTLKVLLKARDEDKKELEARVALNMKRMVVPFVQKLKEGGLSGKQKVYMSVIESNLADLISPFLGTLSMNYASLTPSEARIASLIKEGRATKEIALLLNLSHRTVESHRESIRKKMGIIHKKANLRTCLLSLQ